MAEFNIERRLWTGLTHKRNPNLILEPYRDNSGWKEMKPKFEELHRRIKLETAETISRAEIEYKAHHREPASGVVG